MRKALWLVPLAVALAAAAAAFGGNSSSDRAGSTAAPASADKAMIACGRTRTIGVAAPITGAAASLGQQQLKWARFFVTRYNRLHPRAKLRIVPGDTQLPDTAQAIQVAERLVVELQGPRGCRPGRQPGSAGFVGYVPQRQTSATSPARRRGPASRTTAPGAAASSGSFRTTTSRAHASRTTSGPLCGRSRVVIVDGQDAYSIGLSDTVERILKAAGLNVRRESVNPDTTTDFSSLAARVPSDTQVVYVPWQLAPKAQLFGQQLRAAGRTGNALRLGRALRSGQLQDPRLVRLVLPDRPAQPGHRRIPARARLGRERALRPPELRGDRRRRAGDRKGVPERSGHACRGSALHRLDRDPEGAIAARLPGAVRAARCGRRSAPATWSGRPTSASTGSTPTAPTCASRSLTADVN